MKITNDIVAAKLASYLHHELGINELVDWAEKAMMEAEIVPDSHDVVRDAIARIGLADVRAFGLAWEDCEEILKTLGYEASVEIHAN